MDHSFEEPATSEYGPESPLSGEDSKMSSAPPPKKSKRGGRKRVVSVPIRELEGSKTRGEAYPPSDSWNWRKYGQKPIKGSPYPRGYYRCSSSKGCPARKQVERSHVDPTLLIITYNSDHNHSSPTSKHLSAVATATATTSRTDGVCSAALSPKFIELGDDSLIDPEFSWFSDSASTNLLEIPICIGNYSRDFDFVSLKEEDESLFADLGELPEFSLIFRQRFMELDNQNSMRAVPNLT